MSRFFPRKLRDVRNRSNDFSERSQTSPAVVAYRAGEFENAESIRDEDEAIGFDQNRARLEARAFGRVAAIFGSVVAIFIDRPQGDRESRARCRHSRDQRHNR